jgi:NAD(P)H-hydrate epimerase
MGLMGREIFRTEEGIAVPAVTEEEMRKVDRIAVEDFHLGILPMMENAGRNLALNVLEMLTDTKAVVTVLAGPGGNGGGGICCARHLYNRGIKVSVILSQETKRLTASARTQLDILQQAGLQPQNPRHATQVIRDASLVVDALIGYSLSGAPRGLTAELIYECNQHASRVLSLDLPSGMHATTGETPGVVVQAERTLTLALPKTGLRHFHGDLFLADIGIPPQVYHHLGLEFEPFFGSRYWLRLEHQQGA